MQVRNSAPVASPYLRILQNGARQFLEAFPLSHLLEERGPRVVVTVRPDATLQEVKQAMQDRHVGSVLVTTDGHQPVGILTKFDITLFERLGPIYLAHTAKDHMTKDMLVGSPTMSLSDAMILLATRKGRHLPIVEFVGDSIDGDTRVVDVISAEDIFLFLTRKSHHD